MRLSVAGFGFQQADRAAGNVSFQLVKQVLLALMQRQFMTEFIQKQGGEYGCFYPVRVANTRIFWVIKTVVFELFIGNKSL